MGSLWPDTGPRLSSWLELVKCISNRLLSLGLEEDHGYGSGQVQPRGSWRLRGEPSESQLGRATPNETASLEGTPDSGALPTWGLIPGSKILELDFTDQ